MPKRTSGKARGGASGHDSKAAKPAKKRRTPGKKATAAEACRGEAEARQAREMAQAGPGKDRSMSRWYLTVQFPVRWLKSGAQLDAARMFRGKVDGQSHDSETRPFFRTASAEAAQELVRLFQAEYGQSKATEARPRFSAVAEVDLPTTDRVRHAEAAERVAEDAEQADCWTDGPRYPEGIRGVLAHWHDRATRWLRLMGEAPKAPPASISGAEQTAPAGTSQQEQSAGGDVPDERGFVADPSERAPPIPDDGKPFYKPMYFKQRRIGDELLRRNANDGKKYVESRVRRIRRKPVSGTGKRPVYWYSEPDAKRCWPDKFAGGKSGPAKS